MATPETEQQWLDFALSHHTDQVVRKVSLSPASWKRHQARRHISRAKVLTKMSGTVLNSGSARSRAKHQVLIHTEAETGKAWYDTQKGPLPLDEAIFNQALEQREPLGIRWESTGEGVESARSASAQELSGARRKFNQVASVSKNSKPSRKAIPNATPRSLFAQAGHQCQRCGAREQPWSRTAAPRRAGGSINLEAQLSPAQLAGLRSESYGQGESHAATVREVVKVCIDVVTTCDR